MIRILLLVMLLATQAFAQPTGSSFSIVFSPEQIQIACQEDEILKTSGDGVWACSADASGGGSGAFLDLGDDGDNESTSIGEIATTGDTNSIFSEPSPNKLLITLANDWPKCDLADAMTTNGANCNTGQSPLGVDALGASESCFDVATQAEMDAHTGNVTDPHGLYFFSLADGHLLLYDGVSDNRFENVAMSGDVTIAASGVTTVANDSHTHVVANLSNANAGTDVTADLEEEAHATEHAENAADELLVENLGTACTDGQAVVAASGGLACTSSSPGLIEDMATACPVDTYPVSDGAGNTACGASVIKTQDCSSHTDPWDFCQDWDYQFGGKLFVGNTAGDSLVHIPRLHYWSDCTESILVGDFCQDWDDDKLYYGTSEGNIELGNPASPAGTPTMDQVFAQGSVITGADDANTAFVVSNTAGTSGHRFFVDNGIPTMECFREGGTCDITFDISSGNFLRILLNGSAGITIDHTGAVTLANGLIEYKTFAFGAGMFSTDGTNCDIPLERRINGGPKTWVTQCDSNSGSVIESNAPMPDAYNGGTVIFELGAVNEAATPSGSLAMAFSAMCRRDGDIVDATWGTPVTSTVAFDTQYKMEQSSNVTVTPSGTCASGAHLFWRAVVVPGSTDTQVVSTYITSVKMEYPVNDWSDN